MARTASKIAMTNDNKIDDYFIDSGATNNLFHRRSSFIMYESISTESVSTADGESYLIGKGTVFPPIGKGIIMEAYHAPHFSANIVANSLLSKMFNLFFTSEGASSDNQLNSDRCEILKKGSRSDIVQVVPCINGLYTIKDVANREESQKKHAKMSRTNCSANAFTEWHNKMGHISVQRYEQLSEICTDVPMFDIRILKQHEYMPCFTGKVKKAPVKTNPSAFNDGELHFDISGPMPDSIGDKKYAAHFIEPRTATTTVIPLEKRSELAHLILGQIGEVEILFAHERYRIQVLLCDRAKENYPAEVTDFNHHKGITIPFFPEYAPGATAQRSALYRRILQEPVFFSTARASSSTCGVKRSCMRTGSATVFRPVASTAKYPFTS